MKRFLVDCLAFVAIQALLLAGLESVYQVRVGADHFLAAFRDKDHRLNRPAPPRVLLVGGSSLAFGVNSRALERALGRPVLNLGLNAGLGMEFILRQAEGALRPGDVLVLSPEYNLFGAHAHGDPRILLQQLRVAPTSVRLVSLADLPGLLDEGLSLVSAQLRALRMLLQFGSPRSLYRRASFDERGDVVAHHRQASQRGRRDHVGDPPNAPQMWAASARLRALAARARARGARVFLSPAPIPEDDRAAWGERLDALWSSLARDTGIPVLGTDTAYAREFFLDTAYHLTRDGKRLRTRSLLATLPGVLESGPTAR